MKLSIYKEMVQEFSKNRQKAFQFSIPQIVQRIKNIKGHQHSLPYAKKWYKLIYTPKMNQQIEHIFNFIGALVMWMSVRHWICSDLFIFL